MKIFLRGMHCKSCALLIEEKINELPDVKSVHVDFRRQQADIRSDAELDMQKLAAAVRDAGYEVGEEPKRPWFSKNSNDYVDLAGSLLVLIVIYFVLSKTGLIEYISRFGSGNPQSLFVVLMLGITAGFSTCMAVVGGLLLGVSARHAEKHPSASPLQKFRPHLFFNLGRIISYFILGGLIGLLGSVFSFGGSTIGFLTVLVGLVMLFLGLQLLEIFPRLSRMSFSLPASIARGLGVNNRKQNEYSHRGSIIAGALTFFLPCGFTQAMQLFAMSSGSFWSGAMIMGVFAIGTAPGLLSLGGITSAVTGSFAKKFYKFTGLVVVIFSFVTLSNGYVLSGLKNRVNSFYSVQAQDDVDYQELFNSYGNEPSSAPSGDTTEATDDNGVQIIKTTYVLNTDISPSSFSVKAGKPVKFIVEVNDNGVGCMSTIMVPGLYDTPIYLEKGKTIEMEFIPRRPGVYDIACAMGVPRGKIIVK